MKQREERIKGGKSLPPPPKQPTEEEQLEAYRDMLRRTKGDYKATEKAESAREPVTQEEKEQAAIDAELAALPDPPRTFQEARRDAEDELALKLRILEEEKRREIRRGPRELRKWAEDLAHGQLAHLRNDEHWIMLTRQREMDELRKRNQEYNDYRARHFGFREPPEPDNQPQTKFVGKELEDIITPFGPDPKPAPKPEEPKPRPFMRDMMAEMEAGVKGLSGEKPPQAPNAVRHGQVPHTRGGLFNTFTYLSNAAKQRLLGEKERLKRLDALAMQHAKKMEEDPDFTLAEEEEEESDGASVPYVPKRDPDDVEVPSKVPGVSKPSPVQQDLPPFKPTPIVYGKQEESEDESSEGEGSSEEAEEGDEEGEEEESSEDEGEGEEAGDAEKEEDDADDEAESEGEEEGDADESESE